jgi:GTP-binding protein
MNAKSILFLLSAAKPGQFPATHLPEIAFVGRSNVGKSSLINTLTNIKNLAKTSSTPGKTQMINFFRIGESLMFADLPGYGFSKVPKEVQKQWGVLIESYLKNRDNLKGVVLCLDIRHTPTKLDTTMKEWLEYYRIPIIAVPTKTDKIKRGARKERVRDIVSSLTLDKERLPIIFSAKTREGKAELWKEIGRLTGSGAHKP